MEVNNSFLRKTNDGVPLGSLMKNEHQNGGAPFDGNFSRVKKKKSEWFLMDKSKMDYYQKIH